MSLNFVVTQLRFLISQINGDVYNSSLWSHRCTHWVKCRWNTSRDVLRWNVCNSCNFPLYVRHNFIFCINKVLSSRKLKFNKVHFEYLFIKRNMQIKFYYSIERSIYKWKLISKIASEDSILRICMDAFSDSLQFAFYNK